MTVSVDEVEVAFLGNRTHSRYVLECLLEAGWTIACVVGPGEEMRSEQAASASLADVCAEEDVPFVATDEVGEDHVVELLRRTAPDIGVCAGWTRIVPERVLELPREGFVGVHASPLPEGRGGAPINWQLIHGHDTVGVSLFQFVPEVDHGDIFAQTTVPVEERDDVATVYERVTAATCDLLSTALTRLADGTLRRRPQSFTDATYYPQRKPKDGLVDWGVGVRKQVDWIRAQTHPYPGAFTFLDGERVRLWRATPSELDVGAGNSVHGEVLAVEAGEGVHVHTGSGVVLLQRVQSERRPEAWADEWATRAGVTTGTVLGTPADFPEWLYTGIRDVDHGYAYETNLTPGETATLRAVCCSHASPRAVEVTARGDGNLLTESTLTVDGWATHPVTYGFEESGSHTLQVTFDEGSEPIDRRVLKVYVA